MAAMKLFFVAVLMVAPLAGQKLIRPGHPEWPRAWTTYRTVESIEKDFTDLKAHGVGLVSIAAKTPAEAKQALETARRHGMKYHITFAKINERADIVREAGERVIDALMTGGVYRGRAIDRHLFRFEARRHEIVVEPPVYNEKFAYTRADRQEPAAHYYPDLPDPVRAEVVVPLRKFDGRQHLKIVPAKLSKAPPDTRLEGDSVTPDLPPSSETRQRKLYRLSFDLSGLEGALLDQVGIAVYWPFHGSKAWYIFGEGTVSCAAESTRNALLRNIRESLRVWIDANGGTFPHDVVLAARFGDECFYITGHLHGHTPVVSYPLWDYSAPQIAAFEKRAGPVAYPRTWGYPEIYGTDAYAWWLYSLHEECAALAGIVREEIRKLAPGLLVFRNTTRGGVFSMNNDHDGSGPELLTKNLDIAHLDPYPVSGAGYRDNIPRDMSYYAGLARRYNRILVPWMQAHIYGGPSGLQHVTPDQVDRMAAEQYAQGIDAAMWLGYGPNYTFPSVKPESWKRAAAFHRRLAGSPPPKPQARLAVLRPYAVWALAGNVAEGIRNPADWMLQQWLEVWAVKHSQPYDVFELPPRMSQAESAKLAQDLKRYPRVLSAQPWPGAWVVGEGTLGSIAGADSAEAVRQRFEREMISRGWLKPAR